MATPSSADVPRLELHAFGAPTALLDGRLAPPEVHGRKHLALLIYLALAPGHRGTRSYLAGLLWPDKPESQARHSLKEAVRRLRAHLGPERLISDGESIVLGEAGLVVDALLFDAIVERQPGEAVKLCRGDFLEGFALDDAPPFEEWAAAERTRYRARAAAAMIACAQEALAASRYAEALDTAQRALDLQPYAEPAVRLQMRAAALSGDVARSLAAFHAFATRLAQELGEQPSRELTALADRIRSAPWRRAVPQQADPDPPLVGRETNYREAFTLVAAALQQGPRTLLIGGEPGTGKSRLLAECIERLALDGAVVAVARPLESDHDAPWSTLRSLTRSSLLKAPGSAGADPGALRVLTALAPEGASGPAPVVADAAEVAAAFASLLHAVGEEQPIGLAVDDAHFSDNASIETLGAAVAQLRGVPVLLMVTSVPELEHLPRALLRLHGEVGRRLPGTSVRLEPLSELATRELVLRLSAWCVIEDDRHRLARRIYFETAGNPFLVVTLLRALAAAAPLRAEVLRWPRPGQTTASPLPITLPTLVRWAIAVRFAQLDDDSRQILRAASIGALALDQDLLVTLTGLPRARLEDRLTLLERQHFVAFDGERYRFAAPLVAQVIGGEAMMPGQRRLLRARAIEALAPRTDLDSRLLHAELLAQVEPGPAAFDAAVAVAEAAISLGMTRTTRRALSAAERALPANDVARRGKLEDLRASTAA